MLGLGWGGGLIILFTSHNYALLFGLHGRQDRHGHDHYCSDGGHGYDGCHSHQDRQDNQDNRTDRTDQLK